MAIKLSVRFPTVGSIWEGKVDMGVGGRAARISWNSPMGSVQDRLESGSFRRFLIPAPLQEADVTGV